MLYVHFCMHYRKWFPIFIQDDPLKNSYRALYNPLVVGVSLIKLIFNNFSEGTFFPILLVFLKLLLLLFNTLVTYLSELKTCVAGGGVCLDDVSHLTVITVC